MAFKQQQNQVFGGPEISNIARTPSGVVARALQCMKGVNKDFYESIGISGIPGDLDYTWQTVQSQFIFVVVVFARSNTSPHLFELFRRTL